MSTQHINLSPVAEQGLYRLIAISSEGEFCEALGLCTICKRRPCKGVNCPSTENICVRRKQYGKRQFRRDNAYPLRLKQSQEYLQSIVDLQTEALEEEGLLQ